MPQRLPLAVLALALTLTLAACGSPTAPPAGPLHLGPQAVSEAAAEPMQLDEGQAPLPAPAIDRSVFGGLSAQASFLTCRNEPSGPYYRLQTDPNATGPVNLIQGLGTLPAVTASATAFLTCTWAASRARAWPPTRGCTPTPRVPGFRS